MAIERAQARVLIGVAILALAVPVAALYPYPSAPRTDQRAEIGTVAPPPQPAIGPVYTRPLFVPAEADAPPPDAPALTGVAGRLNRDAVALVRLADGSARTLRIGESVDGWRLESLAIDAAFFTRGRERVRVAMQDEQPPAD
ncbi:hypothetical protein ABS767_16880 [Sphingomonas sp. ST-64]|uniref:General secretion pathway protein N n=1 Tax=Sphingomonas plantiphila TaxID=3163295 RepID=A0ABW8YR84_9SPHN